MPHRAHFYIKMCKALLKTFATSLAFGIMLVFVFLEVVSTSSTTPGDIFLLIVCLDRIIAPLNNISASIIGVHNACINRWSLPSACVDASSATRKNGSERIKKQRSFLMREIIFVYLEHLDPGKRHCCMRYLRRCWSLPAHKSRFTCRVSRLW